MSKGDKVRPRNVSKEKYDSEFERIFGMRTKYCPHCASEKIHRVDEEDGSHYHECEECNETWEHHEEKE